MTWERRRQSDNVEDARQGGGTAPGGLRLGGGRGLGQAAMGPFHCPGDQKVCIDLVFHETLRSRLGAPGDFAQAYVIAHEIGHHVQHLMGISDKVDAMRARSRA
jgi:predicted metalloprotease